MAENDLLAQAIATLEIAVIVLDHEGGVLLGNPAACTLLGYRPDQLAGEHVSAFLPGFDSETLDAQIVPPDSSVTLREATGQHRDGARIPLTLHITSWRNAAAPARHTLALRDISAELALERARSAELLRARNAIRGARIGVFEFDVKTERAHVSDIWRELMELGPDEAVDVQEEWRTRVHPDDLDAADGPMRNLVRGLENRSVSEYRLFTRDRRALQWIRTDLAVAERDAKGNPTRIVGAQVDVTDRKKTEIALRKSVEQFQSAFDNAPIGKAILDVDGKLLKVNLAFCALLGRNEAELKGMGLSMILHPDEIAGDLDEMHKLRTTKKSDHHIERRFVHRNGHIIWGLLSIAAVRDEKDRVVQFIAQVVDASEHHRLQDLKSEFVATVSHELRTPLTSILGALKLLEAQTAGQGLPGPAQRLLEIALQNSDRLALLVNDILDFEKFSKGNIDLEIEDHDLATLVGTAVDENRPLADGYGAALTARLNSGPLHGPVDPARFGQVMAKLLSNAAKFAEKGTEVLVTLDRKGDMARIAVRNRGIGIAPEFRGTIFSPFAQAASSLTRDHGGTGLGLSICKQIVENLGGEIGFDSTPGEMTEFWFTLPLSETQQ